MKKQLLKGISLFFLIICFFSIGTASDVPNNINRWAGHWKVSLDGWQRTMVLRMATNEEIRNAPTNDCTVIGNFFDEREGRKVTYKLWATVKPLISHSSSHFAVIKVYNPNGSLRFVMYAYLFNQNPSEMAGYYEHEGVKYGFYAKKSY